MRTGQLLLGEAKLETLGIVGQPVSDRDPRLRRIDDLEGFDVVVTDDPELGIARRAIASQEADSRAGGPWSLRRRCAGLCALRRLAALRRGGLCLLALTASARLDATCLGQRIAERTQLRLGAAPRYGAQRLGELIDQAPHRTA